MFGAAAAVAAEIPATMPPVAVPPATYSRSAEYRLESKAVGDTFLIQVRLPEKRDPADPRFPVLYVLDGDYWFGAASDIATMLTKTRESPPLLVVGIGYGGTARDWWQKRARDFTPPTHVPAETTQFPQAGGADRFRRFLAEELVPFIERNYPVREGDRTLAGYSLGGLFALHTLFAQPGLFRNFIVLSPAVEWDAQGILGVEADYHARHGALPATVFCAMGEQDAIVPIPAWREFADRMAARGYRDLQWIARMYPGETHVSLFPPGLTHGLKAVHPAEPPAPRH